MSRKYQTLSEYYESERIDEMTMRASYPRPGLFAFFVALLALALLNGIALLGAVGFVYHAGQYIGWWK